MENQNHAHVFVDTVVPATCQEGGYTLHRCDCGYEYKDKFTRTGDHDFAVTELTAATCTEVGSRLLRCKVCGIEKTEPVAATGHRWGDWGIRRVPTCLDDGMEARVCGCCGNTEERVLKATGHKLTQPRKSATKKGVTEYLCENCGQIVEKEGFFRKNRKKIVRFAVAAVVLALLVFVVVPALAPFAHYGLGKLCTSMGFYSAAYWNLQHAEDLFDSEVLLEDFFVLKGYEKYQPVLNGKKPEKRTCWEYDEKGNIKSETMYYNGEMRSEQYVREYDKNGNQLSYSAYNTLGVLYSQGEYVYEYDEKGNKISESLYYNDNLNHVYKYDENGNKISTTYYDGGIIDHKYEYDGSGNITRSTYYNDDGTVDDYGEYEYDENGNKTLYTWYDYGDISSYREYLYDRRGNLVKETDYSADGEIGEYIEYTYDWRGNITKKTEYGQESSLLIDYTAPIMLRGWTTYKHDKDGNITKEARYDSNGNMYCMHKYKYDSCGNLTYQSTLLYDSVNFFDRFFPKSQQTYKWGDYQVFYRPAIQ